MARMTAQEIASAKAAARAAVTADRIGDVTARNQAMNDLFAAAGYWLNERRPSSAARIPPRMVRMPAGRPVRWAAKCYLAAEAWAVAE